MDRRSRQHSSARVEIAADIGATEATSLHAKLRRLPVARHYAGLAGFVCASAAVVAAASWVALSIT